MVGPDPAVDAWLRSTRGADGRLLLTLGGALDLASVAEIAAELDALEPCAEIVMDLAAVEFIDSSGIALLIRMANRAEHVHSVGARPLVRRTIEVLGLAEHLGLLTEGE